jgi:aspartate aminotransferase-like enzyme
MSNEETLWIPGPTHVRPELLEELSIPPVGHRSKAMIEMIERIDPGLRLAFGLEENSSSEVAVGTHSATAMMEGSLGAVGARILSVVNGAFSKRWRDIANVMGKEVRTLEIDWGDAVGEELLAQELKSQGPFDAVTLVLNETSTGVLTPLAPVKRALASSPETLLLIDVVSAIAGYGIDFDDHGVDFALAGINKALALPPGITVMCASGRFLEQARKRTPTTWYLDPVRTIEGHIARKTPTTPCIPLYGALARQLEDISAGRTLASADRGRTGGEAWQARFDKHERMRERTLSWAAGHGIQPFPRRELSSPTISCLSGTGIDVGALMAGLKQDGFEIGNGYGPLKGETFRIGHMGDHTEAALEDLLKAASRRLRSDQEPFSQG